MTFHSSPNRVVWDYFLSLRLLVQHAREAPSPELARQATALAVIMAVTVGEIFLNLWFRVKVEEAGDKQSRDSFLKEISSRISLDKKLRQWPERYLGKPLSLVTGPGAEFLLIKTLRNSIVHFTSTHESIDLGGGISIHGLADTTGYDSLTHETAVRALTAAEGLVSEVFVLAGVSRETLPDVLHTWTGRPVV